MSLLLLDKTRKFQNLLKNRQISHLTYEEICTLLSQLSFSYTSIINESGDIIGSYETNCEFKIEDYCQSGLLLRTINDNFLQFNSTKENVDPRVLGFDKCNIEGLLALIVPIIVSGERLGTLFLCKSEDAYNIDDIILTEYVASIIGIKMIIAKDKTSNELSRNKETALSALESLSTSEKKAVKYVYEEISAFEGIIVISKLSDKYNITRSIIVNAIKKLDSANVIESKSLGAKGTFIKIINPIFFQEL